MKERYAILEALSMDGLKPDEQEALLALAEDLLARFECGSIEAVAKHTDELLKEKQEAFRNAYQGLLEEI